MPLMRKYIPKGLSYLDRRPRRINWEVVAGNPYLSLTERYDLIYDDYDLKIRGLLK